MSLGYCPRTTPPAPLTRIDRIGVPTVAEVIRVAANAFGVTTDDLVSQSRRQPLVFYRQIAMAAARAVTTASYPAIAHMFGDRDHTTVIHACRRMADDPRLAALINQCGGAS